ncbi:MAG: hypothetical protein U1C97_02325 [Candidatus Gracilibacteria bacterium]|nr:hypothetical protein [bacterium]MDZ4217132.1 hypothetical protein [Candidatus Gracilibacteria bacterium]
MFQAIVGHDRIKDQLKSDLETKNFHQSYLFSGPEHIGKMSLLREFLSLVRTQVSFDPESVFGRQVMVGQGPGFISFLDDGETLKVDEVRKIVDFVSRRTAEGEVSFCVIEHLERMTRSAANAFLKVLEEPSERFVYLMTTREEKKLLPTIRSRVQFFRFTLLPGKAVESFLLSRVKNEVMVQELMKLSAGRIGLALSMMKDAALLDRMRELYDYAMLIFEKDIVDRFHLAEHLSQKEVSSAELSQFLMFLALKLKQEGTQRYLKQLDRLQEVSQLFEDTQVNRRLVLEDLFLGI